jgi:hypothetical protein
MADTVSSPNMSMPVPVVGVDPGPQWATDLNSCLGILDQHDHSPGLGVQITPNGLNINAALTMGGNFLTEVAGVTLSAQLSPPANGTVYLSGSDLYYVDGVGNNIRMTQSGSVAGSAGTITGLPSGTASASYSAGTFVFQASTNTGAVIDGGSFILRNNAALSKGLTLSPPNAMGADYSLVLPALPVSTKFLSLDSSGNISAVWAVDNTTLEISTNSLQIKAGGVGTPQLADGSVTKEKQAAVGQQISASCGTYFGTTGGSLYDITNLSVTLTTTGRPVMLMLVGNGTNDAYFEFSGASGGTNRGIKVAFVEGSTVISLQHFSPYATTTTRCPASAFSHFYVPAAGTYTYKVQMGSIQGSPSILAESMKLVAYEL